MESMERTRKVPCTVRCWRTGHPTELRSHEGVQVCPECGTVWPLEDLEEWHEVVETALAVMSDHIGSMSRWSTMMKHSRDGVEAAKAALREEHKLTIAEALELTEELLSTKREVGFAVQAQLAKKLLSRFYLFAKEMQTVLHVVREWSEWRKGQCDYPKGINEEEKALLEIQGLKG